MMKLGIDISANQGVVNFSALPKELDQIIIRSTVRTHNPDAMLSSYVKGCMDHKIPFSFYKYSYAMNFDAAKYEAIKVIKALEEIGVKPNKNITIWGDYEHDPQLALPTNTFIAIVNAQYQVYSEAGYSFGIYMGKYDYEKCAATKQFNVPVWIARYYLGYNSVSFGTKPNEAYKPKSVSDSPFWGWQYTSTGIVKGINGRVDMNAIYGNVAAFDDIIHVEPEYYTTPEFTLIQKLAVIGVYPSYSNRAKLAEANGIVGYKGTLEQNLLLSKLIDENKLVKCEDIGFKTMDDYNDYNIIGKKMEV